MDMFEELKAWADKWGIQYEAFEPTGKWPFKSIVFSCGDYQEPAFHYNPNDGHRYWTGGE